MSESLHEAIKEVAKVSSKQEIIKNALKEAAANVQTRVGSNIPVIYRTKKGGTVADWRRNKKNVLKDRDIPISRVSLDLMKKIEGGEARATKTTQEAVGFGERVLEAAYSPISRAGRLGKVIAGRASQSATEKDPDKKDKLLNKLHNARRKLIGQGAEHASDKMMADITRKRHGLKK
mgnify:CR=1 FL=1